MALSPPPIPMNTDAEADADLEVFRTKPAEKKLLWMIPNVYECNCPVIGKNSACCSKTKHEKQ